MRHIGVDLHKTNFVACFLDEQDKPAVKTFALTEQGLLTFQRALTRSDEVAVEMSANAYYFYDRIVNLVRRVVLVDAYRFAVVSRSKKKREKGSGKAICATARKLLTVIYVMLKRGQDYWYAEEQLYGQKLSALEAAA